MVRWPNKFIICLLKIYKGGGPLTAISKKGKCYLTKLIVKLQKLSNLILLCPGIVRLFVSGLLSIQPSIKDILLQGHSSQKRYSCTFVRYWGGNGDCFPSDHVN